MATRITTIEIERTWKTVRRRGKRGVKVGMSCDGYVILSREDGEGSLNANLEFLRCAQDDGRPSLSNDCKVSSTLRAVTAIRMEERTLASRAETGVDDALRRQAALAEDGNGEAGQIDVRFGVAAIDVAIRVLVTVLKLIGHFLPHFEAADANGRTEPGVRGGRVEVGPAVQRVECGRGDAPDGAAPTGVNVGDDRTARIDQRHRKAIGDLDGKGGLLVAAPERVAG